VFVGNQKLSGVLPCKCNAQELAVNTGNWRMITDRYAVANKHLFLGFFIAFIEEDSALVVSMCDMLAI
jgi:hypothetical protein